MKGKSKQSGITLTEMAVVIAAIAVLAAFSMPAVRTLRSSFESASGTRAMISAALASARAIAAKEQHYAGVRFQKAYHLKGPLEASQYMIFIVQDPEVTGTYGYGFRAVEGTGPIKLPDSFGVMDFTIVEGHNRQKPVNPANEQRLDDPSISDNEKDDLINDYYADTTAFSIIFSPSGKLVIHGIRVRNRDGETNNSSEDDIFNTEFNVEVDRIAMFYQDDYFAGSPPDLGLGPEPSRRSFIIYDRDEFRVYYDEGTAYTEYLQDLEYEMIHINPYTGTMIER